METSLKTGFAQISLAAQKIQVAQNLGMMKVRRSKNAPFLHH